MSGVDWRALGRETFNEIVDILLGREHGARGHAVNGRGGDGGIDYNVDDARIIFQYKFFCDGFPIKSSRRPQIQRSFKRAMAHGPDEWILVVPATVTPEERRFVMGLGKGRRVQISIRDQVWLNDQLIKNRDVAEHYRFGSDVDYLYAKAERFKHNPVVRDTGDVVDRVRGLRDAIETADPNWTLDVHSAGDRITQVLRAKDPGAPARAPIEISFTAALPSDSDEARDLEQAAAFGYTKPIVLPGAAIKDFTVTGTRLLGNNDGAIEQLEFHPLLDGASAWKPSEVVLFDADGDQLGVYLAETRLLSQGQRGFTLQAKVGRFIDFTFRCPNEATAGEADFASSDLADAPIHDAFEAADFMIKLNQASIMEIQVDQTRVAAMDIGTALTRAPITEGFAEIHPIADDLRVIESATSARFRFPTEIQVIQRIMIRNLRLMLEGHCVAHPTDTRFTATLNGMWHDSLEQVLSTEFRWLRVSLEPAAMTILGQTVRLPTLSRAAYMHLEQADVDALRASFTAGTAEGHVVHFTVRPGDRVRMFLPDRVAPGKPLEITPWELTRVEQRGLGPDGAPLASS